MGCRGGARLACIKPQLWDFLRDREPH
jgi:hypothetical protein